MSGGALDPGAVGEGTVSHCFGDRARVQSGILRPLRQNGRARLLVGRNCGFFAGGVSPLPLSLPGVPVSLLSLPAQAAGSCARAITRGPTAASSAATPETAWRADPLPPLGPAC